MRLLRLHLQAFGPFTGRILDLARGGARLALIYGPNEAGKSATLRAIGDLRFGVPQLSADNFRPSAGFDQTMAPQGREP